MTTPMTRYCIAALLMVMCLLNTAQAQVCTEEYAATILWVDWEFFSCGQPSIVTVTVRNEGTLDWQRIIDPTQGSGDVGFKLGLNPPAHPHQGSIDGPSRVQMDVGEVVGCGELKEFVFTMTPDAGLVGHQQHAYVFQMVDEWNEWFGEVEDSDAIVECDFDDCTGIPLDSDLSWVVPPPSVMECGQSFQVRVRAENTGTRDWRAIDNVELATHEGSSGPFGVDPVSVPGGSGVDCDSETTFLFPITAPEVGTTTTYSLTPQMSNPGGWFGDDTLTRNIDVHCDDGGGTPQPPPIAGDDIVSVCDDRPAIVDVLANDSSPSGNEPAVSRLSSTCGGQVTHLGDGIFDVTSALMTAPTCYFDYQLAEDTQATTATVTLRRDFFCSASGATPLLTLHPVNKRYVTGDSLTATYLAGSHVWQNLQDYGAPPIPTTCGDESPPHSCGAEEWDFLRFRGNNFTRGWVWEQEHGFAGTTGYQVQPMPYLKNGDGSYDLNRFNDAYFDRLRGRVQQAADRGLYVSVMLFQGWSHQQRRAGNDNPWLGHPFHPNNNSTFGGYNLDLNGNGTGEEMHTLNIDPQVTQVQRAYINRYIQELNDFDNIIWEVCNECGDNTGSISIEDTFAWMNEMAEQIKQIELTKYPKQHLVWMTSTWGGTAGVINAELMEGPADLVALQPNPGWKTNPPQYDPPPGNEKAVLFDTDHGLNCGGLSNDYWCSVVWPWKMFLRGYNPVLMDAVRTLLPADGDNSNPDFDPIIEETRLGLGQTVYFANSVVRNLAAMIPNQGLSSTGYVLANAGVEYLVLQPESGAFTVFLEAGDYDYQWFDIRAGSGAGAVVETGTLSVTTASDQPFERTGQDWVLYLFEPTANPDPEPVITLTATPDTINLGESTLIEWNIQNATPGSCVGFVNAEPWPGTVTIPSGSASASPNETTTFRIECSWSMGVVSALMTVIVNPLNPPTDVTSFAGFIAGINVNGLEIVDTAPLIAFSWDPATHPDGIDFYEVHIRRDDNAELLYSEQAFPPSTTHSIQTNGLIPDTSYSIEINARATNGEWGNWINGGVFTVVTDPMILTANDDPIVFDTPAPAYNIPAGVLIANDDPNTGVTIGGFMPPAAEFGELELAGPPDTFVYTPPAGFPGGDVTFTYYITDGTETSNNAVVTMSVPAFVPELIANDDSIVFDIPAPAYNIPAGVLIANDVPNTGVTIGGFMPPAAEFGDLELAGPPDTFVYTPPPDFPGGDVTFTYYITDGIQTSEDAVVTMSVPAFVPELLAVSDHVSLGTVQPNYEVLHSALTANDTGQTGFYISAVTQPTVGGGTLLNLANTDPPKLVYLPPPDFLGGRIRFTYTITDDISTSTVVSFLWVFNVIDDGPREIFICGSDNIISVLSNDFGRRLRVKSVTQPNIGTVTKFDRHVTFAGPPDKDYDAVFTYTANDFWNQLLTGTVHLYSRCHSSPPG